MLCVEYTRRLMKNLLILTLILSIIGLADASYLTFEHYSQYVAPCSTNMWVDCGKVLDSEYSVVLGIPLAMLGAMFYAGMATLSLIRLSVESVREKIWSMVPSLSVIPKRWSSVDRAFLDLHTLGATFGGAFSLYLIYLQIGVIGSICLYCMLSAGTSIGLFLSLWTQQHLDRRSQH